MITLPSFLPRSFKEISFIVLLVSSFSPWLGAQDFSKAVPVEEDIPPPVAPFLKPLPERYVFLTQFLYENSSDGSTSESSSNKVEKTDAVMKFVIAQDQSVRQEVWLYKSGKKRIDWFKGNVKFLTSSAGNKVVMERAFQQSPYGNLNWLSSSNYRGAYKVDGDLYYMFSEKASWAKVFYGSEVDSEFYGESGPPQDVTRSAFVKIATSIPAFHKVADMSYMFSLLPLTDNLQLPAAYVKTMKTLEGR